MPDFTTAIVTFSPSAARVRLFDVDDPNHVGDERRIALLIELEWPAYALIFGLAHGIANRRAVAAVGPFDRRDRDIDRVERLCVDVVRRLVIGLAHPRYEGLRGRQVRRCRRTEMGGIDNAV